MSIKQRTCRTFPEFLKVVAEVIEEIPPVDRRKVLLWRGQADSTWPLTPGLQRDRAPDSVRETERTMFRRFTEAAPYLLPSVPTNEWDQLSMAQHFGLQTRLLDWTVNSSVALWFALASHGQADAAVWAFRPGSTNLNEREKRSPFKVHYTTAFCPTHHSHRVAAQAGWHTAHKYEQGRGLVALDFMSSHHEHLRKIVIPASARARLLAAVEGTGVTVQTVYWDLGRFCEYVNSLSPRPVRKG